jgi:glycosyltransferase involved in cell wall biosynthesis
MILHVILPMGRKVLPKAGSAATMTMTMTSSTQAAGSTVTSYNHLPKRTSFVFTEEDALRRNVLRIIGDLPVICNSQQAAREWDGGEGRLDRYGSPQFRAIIHGYVDEFFHYPLAHRNRGAITICSGGDLSRWYHGLPLVERLKRDVPLTWVGGNDRGDTSWCENYTAYRVMLASSLIYFSPTRRGPMPGARTEAMLSGCCVVSVPGNDFEDYIKNDVNGFIVDTYVQARDCLLWLLENPSEAWEIGQRGREDARVYFDAGRYRNDWMGYLSGI